MNMVHTAQMKLKNIALNIKMPTGTKRHQNYLVVTKCSI
jgi:hypothetical protein